MYKLFRFVLFQFDAEKVHYFAMNALRFLCSIGFIRKLLATSFQPTAKNLAVEKWGLEFKNPVGLAAGFDKNAVLFNELGDLGFGFVEIGENENQSKVQYGDVFFTTSSETPNEIGTTSILLNEVVEVYLNSFCFGFRPNSLNELVPEFAQFLLSANRSSVLTH